MIDFDSIKKKLHIDGAINFYQCVDDLETKILLKALNTTDWNFSRTAKILRIPLSTLRSMIEKKGLKR